MTHKKELAVKLMQHLVFFLTLKHIIIINTCLDFCVECQGTFLIWFMPKSVRGGENAEMLK